MFTQASDRRPSTTSPAENFSASQLRLWFEDSLGRTKSGETSKTIATLDLLTFPGMRLNIRAAALLIVAVSAPAQSTEQLPYVVVTGKRAGDKPVLRGDLVATESLTVRDIEKSGAITLTEALDKRPGIALQTECSICSVRNVVLNNLPGRFTTVMIDGIPIFSSVSSAYGLDSVNLGGIERIDVSRGAGASLIAPEALAGTVNVISRRPEKNEFLATQQFGRFGQIQTVLFGAHVLNGGALTATINHHRHRPVDHDSNRVSEYSGYRRNLGGIGFFVNDVAGFKARGRLDVVNEKRGGGAIGNDYAHIKADIEGNPFDWSSGPNGSPDARGWVTPDGSGADRLVNGQQGFFYDGGRAGMSEIIVTDRAQFIASGTRRLGAGTLRLALGFATHKQDSFYEKSLYKVEQQQTYAEASTQQPLGETLLTAGINYRFEDLSSRGQNSTGAPNDGIDDYAYRAPGLFLQAWRSLFNDTLEANGSLRIDRHNVFGTIISPRINLLWNHDDHLNSRFAAGKGYRAPTSFYEQDHGILDTTRIDRRINRPEISHNAAYTLSYSSDRLSWAGGVHWNKIVDMALLDSGQTDPITGAAITVFASSAVPFKVAGADVTVTYKLTPVLDATVGMEATRYDFTPGTMAFARPDKRVYLRLDYASGPWDLFARATWTGSQDLARFYDYPHSPRYNLNGTPKLAKSPAFWQIDVRGERRFNKRWSGFIGVENLVDFKQPDKDSFLWLDSTGRIDVTHIWGPNRGRFVYAGAKLSL